VTIFERADKAKSHEVTSIYERTISLIEEIQNHLENNLSLTYHIVEKEKDNKFVVDHLLN
jgi:hypothetical protein